MIEKISRTAVRQRKHLRVREKISGKYRSSAH